MLGRTPREAWRRYEDALQEALGCIAQGRFVLQGSTAGLRVDTDYSVALNAMDSVPLHGALRFAAGQIIRLHEEKPEHIRDRYRIQTIAYTYILAVSDGKAERELLTFHWHRNRVSPRVIPAGHLHIGRGLLANPAPVRSDDFHRAHIPTGYIDFTAIVRFAIVELGVAPLTPAWASRLEHAVAALPLTERRL